LNIKKREKKSLKREYEKKGVSVHKKTGSLYQLACLKEKNLMKLVLLFNYTSKSRLRPINVFNLVKFSIFEMILGCFRMILD
jgi:hypothetical protein